MTRAVLLTLPVAAPGIEPLNVMVMVEPLGIGPVVSPAARAAAVFGDAGGHTAEPVEAQVHVVPVKFVIVASVMTAPVTEPGPAFVTSKVYANAWPGTKLDGARFFDIWRSGDEIVNEAVDELLVAPVSRSRLAVMLAVLFTVPDDAVGPTKPVTV